MATTETSRLATSASDKTYSYAAIATFDGTTIEDSDILEVYDNGGLLELTTHYTVDTVNEDIILNPGYDITTGDRIVIKRVTDGDDQYVDFVNNVSIDESDLDLATKQNFFLIQEIATSVGNALQYDIVNDCWDANSLKICNLAPGTVSTDAITYGQAVALISGTDIAETGDGIYDTASGDGTTDTFELPDFPTTEIDAQKIIVTINGLDQIPTTDYTYALSVSSVPTVTFTTAPPNGTTIAFRTVQGIVSSSYEGESIDGDAIITNTLDGDRIIDGTLDGDALIDQTVDVDKLDGGSGAANRLIVFDASGVGTAQAITHDNITHTGAGTRTDIGDAQLDDSHVPTAVNLSTTPVYTNSTSKTQFMIAQIRVQSTGGTVVLTPSGGSAMTMFSWTSPGGAIQDIPISFFVPPSATVTFTSTGGTLRQIVTQEV